MRTGSVKHNKHKILYTEKFNPQGEYAPLVD